MSTSYEAMPIQEIKEGNAKGKLQAQWRGNQWKEKILGGFWFGLVQDLLFVPHDCEVEPLE